MRSSIDTNQLHTSMTMSFFLSILSFIPTSPIFSCSFDLLLLRLIICDFMFFFVFFFNNSSFLVKVRLLRLCLVLENVKEKGKEIERKNVRKKNMITIIHRYFKGKR